ncbi:hypothetical protein E4U21_006246 [Claviceps maximensis]|nr:hypothetical protein E4U21_006246 [Claviceps maximensis]
MPEQELSTFVGPPRPIIDGYWTARDETWLTAAWNRSTTKLAFSQTEFQSQELLKLWRLSCTLMRCSPVAIISPQYGLVYEGIELNTVSSLTDHDGYSLWSEGFCKALSSLVVHSFWRGDAKLLATCIQYSVLCRTDDRQPCKLAMSPSSCLDVENLRDISASHRHRHIHLLQTDYSASQTAHGRELSLEFEFMSYLGSVIEKPPISYAERQSDAHPPIYAVQTADLNRILHALNTFNPNGFPLFTHSDVFLGASQSAPLQQVFPREDQLCELHRRSFWHETRMAYRTVRASKWTPPTPRGFLPGVPPSSAEPFVNRSRMSNGKPAPEVITILDDEDKPRLGLNFSGSENWPGSDSYSPRKRRRQQHQQQQQQSPHRKKRSRNQSRQRQGTTPGPYS